MPHDNTSHPPNQTLIPTGGANQSEPLPTPKQQCKIDGGVWNEEKQRCIFPDKVTPKDVEVFDFKGGVKGVETPQGRSFLANLSPEELESIRAGEQRQSRQEVGFAEAGTAQRAADIQEQQRALQETGAPVRRELDPTLQTGEDFPIVGPLLTKIRKALGLRPEMRSLIDVITGKGKTGEEFFELQPEELKTLALTQIERQEIERGLTDSEQFGSFVEALPFGSLSNFAAEKPSENVQTVLKSLRILKSRAIDVELKFNKGLISKGTAEERLTLIENEIQRGESRMILLIQNSPELKFNSDGVNFIELKILESRERLFDSRLALIGGPNTDPTELDILLGLQEDIEGEDFDIK